jgi:gamma-polyglutamate biosynthesis protein CapC
VITGTLLSEVATLGLAIGLVFSLVCYLATNLSPGGMITPGWLALTMVEDYRRAGIIVVTTGLTFLLTKLLQRVVILYGKRLFAAVVMFGVFLQMTLYLILVKENPLMFAQETLGFIVPGLIAYQLIRQPVIATTVATAAVTGITYVIVISGLLLRLVP